MYCYRGIAFTFVIGVKKMLFQVCSPLSSLSHVLIAQVLLISPRRFVLCLSSRTVGERVFCLWTSTRALVHNSAWFWLKRLRSVT